MKRGYKKTEVGIIPEDWEVKPLGDLLKKGRLGGNYPNQVAPADFPLMKMGNLQRGEFDVSKVEFVKPGVVPESIHRLRHGDVLFNTRNTLDLVGKVAMWRDELPEAYYNSNLMRLEFEPNEICSPAYANAALNSSSSITLLRGMATGTTSVAAIYTRDLMALPVAKAPLPEQRAIAEALSDVDGLLGGLDRLIDKKRDLKQAAMQQLLTAQTRLPGFHGEWLEQTLGDLLTKAVGGGTPSRSNPAYWGDEIPWVTVKDFATFSPNHTQEYITNAGLNNSASNLIPAGTIITSTRMALGRAVVYNVDVSINQDLKALFIKSEVVRGFLLYWFEVSSGVIDELGSGSTVKGISLSQLRALPVNLPPKAEQTAIAEVLGEIDGELAALERRREKTRALKEAMMQQLLTGQTRLI